MLNLCPHFELHAKFTNLANRWKPALLFWLVLANTQTTVGEPTWQIFQITNGADLDFQPDVSGQTYVWQRNVSGANKIMMWSEGDVNPVEISTGTKEFTPRISNGQVVWQSQSGSGSDFEVFKWAGGVLTSHTNNNENDQSPDISGSNLLWLVNTWYLIFDDGFQQTQITAGQGVDHNHRVDGRWVVWEAGQPDREIYHWNDGVMTQLTDNTYHDNLPDTDGTSIVWQALIDSNTNPEIMKWNMADGVKRLTHNDFHDSQPDVSGEIVAYVRDDGNDFEVFFRFRGLEYQLTNNNYDDFEPTVDADRIVWQGQDNGGRHIFYATLSGLDGPFYGSCCLSATCSLLPELDCETAGGVFNGIDTPCTVDTCGSEAATSWSTFQHDFRRSGLSPASVAQTPHLVWDLFIDNTSNANVPVVAPDGTTYVTGLTGLVAVNDDGTFKWNNNNASSFSAAVRQDGVIFSGLSKLDVQGNLIPCNLSVAAIAPMGIDANGNVYLVNGSSGSNWSLRKINAGCEQQWQYNGADQGPASHPAMDSQGDVLAAGETTVVKLDSDSGNLIWSYPTGDFVGALAVGPDDTTYCSVGSNKLLAIKADGTEKWLHTFTDPTFRVSANRPSPAIDMNGDIYFVGELPLANKGAIVSLTPAGVERWWFSDVYGEASPVLDSSGVVLIAGPQAAVTGLSTIDGTKLWQLALGLGDDVRVPPTIRDDGTILVVTDNGHLLAFESTCLAPPPKYPPVQYRKVAQENETINNIEIGQIEDLEILESGLVVFLADVPSSGASGVFIEQSDGAFVSIIRGDIIDGREIDDVALPRFDVNGVRYLPARVVDVGNAIFVDDTMYLAEENVAGITAPVIVDTIDNWRYVDHDNTGRFLTVARSVGVNGFSLLSIDSTNGAVTPLLGESDTLDGFVINNLKPDGVRGYADDGTAVLRLENGQFAIGTQSNVIVRTGDVVDSIVINSPRTPRRTSNGDIYYLSDERIFSYSALGEHVLHHDLGVVVAGQPITEITNFDVNDAGDTVYWATMLGTFGIVINDFPIAIAEISEINGVGVTSAGGQTADFVSINESAQAAFIASRMNEFPAIWVATPNLGVIPDIPFDSDHDGDVDNDDFDNFVDCYNGALGGAPTCACLSNFDDNADMTVDCLDWQAFKTFWTDAAGIPFFRTCDPSICPIESDQQCQFGMANIAINSDASVQTRSADDFIPLSDTISKLCWKMAWSCASPPDHLGFTVNFYLNDANNLPDETTGPIASYTISFDGKAQVGISAGGLTIFSYTASLSPPMNVTPGNCYWLEIVAEGDGQCLAGWLTTSDGIPGNPEIGSTDGNSWMVNTGDLPYSLATIVVADLSWCLDVDIEKNTIGNESVDGGCGVRHIACCGDIGNCGEALGWQSCTLNDGSPYPNFSCADNPCTPPPNDDCTSAQPINNCVLDTNIGRCNDNLDETCSLAADNCSGGFGLCQANVDGAKAWDCGTMIVDNRQATTDGPITHNRLDLTGDCAIANPGHLSDDVWFTFTALGTGTLILEMCDSLLFDAFIAVYDNSTCPIDDDLSLLECADDNCAGWAPRLSVDMIANSLIPVRVGGVFDATGLGNLQATFFCTNCSQALLEAAQPFDVTTDRYLSFDPSTNNGQMTALRVTRVGSTTSWYVSCSLQNAGADGQLGELVQTAEFCNWTDSVIHVRGCAIVPGNDYVIEATVDESIFSLPLLLSTTPPQFDASRQFGDVVGGLIGGTWSAPDGLVTANDIVAVVQKFQLNPSAPHLSRVDNDGKIPNGIVAGNDILREVIAFAGGDFGFGVTNCLAGTCIPSCP